MLLAGSAYHSRFQDSTRPLMFTSRSLQVFQATARALRSSLCSPSTTRWMSAAPQARGSAAARAKAASAPDDVEGRKARALEAAIKDINNKCGSGTVMHFGPDQEVDNTPTVPTGALTLDYAVGGGWPKGRIVEIYGNESTGKSTLAMHAMAECQKLGGKVAYIDAENGFSRDFAKMIGMDLASPNFYYVTTQCAEEAFYTMDRLISSGCIDMIVVDSVAALVPRAEFEGEVGQPQMGIQARIMSQGLRKVTGLCSRHATTLLFLNQVRNKIVPYGNPETTTGGLALKFYSSIRIRLSRSKAGAPGTDANGEERGIRVKAQVMKNKCAPPFRVAEFDILWTEGIASLGCMLDMAEKVGAVQKRGSWYKYQDVNLAQGRDKMMAHLEANPDFAIQMESETRAKLSNPDVGSLLETSPPSSFDPDDESESDLADLEAEA